MAVSQMQGIIDLECRETIRDEQKKSIGGPGIIVLGTIGAAVAGIYALTLPFVSPALRRVCLPYVPATTTQVKNVMAALQGRSGKVLDLGSGDGRLVIEAARNGFIAEGVELNYWLVLFSRMNSWRQGLHDKTRFTRRDLWKISLADYHNVIIFGVEEMMKDLEAKASKELDPSSCVIACRFPFPSLIPTCTIGQGIDTVWVYHLRNTTKL